MSGDTEQLIDCLKGLQSAQLDTRERALAAVAQADRLLDLVFDLSTENTKISNENRDLIGPFLETSLKSIEISIKHVAACFNRNLYSEVLRKRSSLQFLIDDFGDYPTTTPGNTFSKFNSDLKELVKILDDLIAEWKAIQGPEDPDSNHDVPEGLPASHTWWKL